jgi:hypothetical protein
MSESQPNYDDENDGLEENENERIFSREEILAILEKHVQASTPGRELSDEKGIYLLEVTTDGENPGEINEYRFQRKGNFGENQSLNTVLQIAYYDADGIPEGGRTLQTYNEDTGSWE